MCAPTRPVIPEGLPRNKSGECEKSKSQDYEIGAGMISRSSLRRIWPI